MIISVKEGADYWQLGSQLANNNVPGVLKYSCTLLASWLPVINVSITENTILMYPILHYQNITKQIKKKKKPKEKEKEKTRSSTGNLGRIM